MTDSSVYLGHFDDIGQFLVRDAATHMPPGAAADRTQQLGDISAIKQYLLGQFNAKADPYQNLKDRFSIAARMDEIQQLMNKDAELFVADADKPRRQELVTTLGTVRNMMIADPAVSQWLDAAEAGKDAMAAEDRRNLALMRRSWVHEASLTPQMAGDVAQMAAKGEELHTSFRNDGDWSKIKDWYGKAFDLMRTVGTAKKQKLGVSTIYEALMDTFSPGLRDATVAAEFGRLEKDLPALIRQVVEKQTHDPAVLPLPKTTMAQQEELSRRVANAMCFDFDKGRMDMCDGHPSCATVSDYSWFTVDYIEDNFLEAVMTTAHEGWHGRYAQNLPAAWRHQPAGADLGMTVHESMSQIGELYAGRSKAFFKFIEKEARDVFNLPDDPALDADNLERYLTRAKPSFIRIYADEVTYPAHIILHTKLERAIIEGELDVKDYETAFNKGMQDLLGITPPSQREGCGQDVHIPSGWIGYKPAYLMSRMVLAQLAAAAGRDYPEMKREYETGDFASGTALLDKWVAEHVQSKGSLLTFDELMLESTGETLNAKYYLDDLSKRYLGHPWTPSGPAPASGPPQPSAF